MARALVIKNVDFSVNKLTTVAFNDTPCTGISLNKNSMSISAVGDTDTLIATVTPSDTTDAIIWSSSNLNVATVSGGVVTATGCGTATITATCGNHSATCGVTVTHVVSLGTALNRYLGKDNAKEHLDGGDLDNYAIGFSTTGINTRRISYADRSYDRYPVLIPNGATKINITSANFSPYGFWLNTQEGADILQSIVAFSYNKDDFGTSPTAVGNRIITIPDRTTGTYAGVDSCAFVFRYRAGTITQELVDEIVITFTAN